MKPRLLVLLWVISSLSYGQTVKLQVKKDIPPRAYTHLTTIITEKNRLHPYGPTVAYYPSLIEHESCISLTHKRCWSPTSRLKTAREEGAGLPQITRAYRKDGSLRFDKLTEMAEQYVEELEELSWDNVYSRPDLQIRVVVLLTRENWNRLHTVKDRYQRLAMTDSAYNGGYRDVSRARQICGLKKDCDPQYWFEHTENYLPKSTKVLYGTRSALDINKHHVRDVLQVRLPKYFTYYYPPVVPSYRRTTEKPKP